MIIINEIDFLPSYINNTDFRCIDVDSKYLGALSIVGYPKKSGFLDILESIPKHILYDMSIYIKKQDTSKILKELTYSISSTNTELKSNNKNQIDIDILDSVTKDARELRKEIQVNNEEVFYVSIIVCFYSNSKELLLNNLKEFQSILYSRNVISNILNFRQLDSYISTLPINSINKKLLDSTYRNFTTSALSNIFPFYTKTVLDKNGILFGYTQNENRMCTINTFDEKYLNANMCIFGSSGSGKSYFVKLLVIRNFFINKSQYIIDPEGEYSKIVTELGGDVLSLKSGKHINIFDITKLDLSKDFSSINGNFLDRKVDKITNFLISFLDYDEKNFNIKQLLKSAIYKLYKKNNITQDINSIYENKLGNDIYIEKKILSYDKFPTLNDLVLEIEDNSLRESIKEKVIDRFEIFNGHTNVNLFNKLVCLDLSSTKLEDAIIIVKFFFYFLQEIFSQNKSSILYFDEVWKYIYYEKLNISQEIFTMFKTIRKQNAAIVAITQDVSDFFNYEGGNYGKSVLNNSLFKIFFKLEYSDLEILDKFNVLNEETLTKISSLNKGNMFISFNSNKAFLKVIANDFEKEMIGGK